MTQERRMEMNNIIVKYVLIPSITLNIWFITEGNKRANAINENYQAILRDMSKDSVSNDAFHRSFMDKLSEHTISINAISNDVKRINENISVLNFKNKLNVKIE